MVASATTCCFQIADGPIQAADLDLLTPEQLAERLQVKVSWVYEQTRSRAGVRSSNPLPHIRAGKYLRFHWPDVAKWLEGRQSNGGQKK